MLTICVWKWHGRTMGFSRPDYSAQHVNVMASMLDRNLRTPHEVVCITDDAEGIDGGIRVVPIWDDLKQHGRCFRRLKLFASEMRDLVGERIVSLDLDTVIVGPVDDVFNRPEPFVIWSDPSRLLPYCGSQWMLTAGYRPEVFDRFNYETWRRLKPERNWHGSDQAWMAYMLPGAATWGKTDGIYSYRLDLLREGPRATWARFKRRSRIYRKPTLPENARIVHFHGVFDPSQSIIQSAVPWVAEHWR